MLELKPMTLTLISSKLVVNMAMDCSISSFSNMCHKNEGCLLLYLISVFV